MIREKVSGQENIFIISIIGFLFLYFIDLLIGSDLISFTLTFLFLGIMAFFLILIRFRKSKLFFSWSAPKPSQFLWEGLIEKKILTLKGASNQCSYSKEEIAKILKNSLMYKRGYNSYPSVSEFFNRTKLSNELSKKLGKNKKLLEIFNPQENEHRKNLFFRWFSRSQENYLTSLEEAIKFIKE